MKPIGWFKAAAAVMLLTLALVPIDSFLHGHDGDSHGDDHCAICHVRHLSFVETSAPTSTLTPTLLVHGAVAEAYSSELDAALSLHPSRGPPA